MSASEERAYESRPAVIREANEEIAVKAAALHFVSRIPMLCECGDPACHELVLLTLEEYRRARRSRPYLTAPGHGERLPA
jgi:hypothetical protein